MADGVTDHYTTEGGFSLVSKYDNIRKRRDIIESN